MTRPSYSIVYFVVNSDAGSDLIAELHHVDVPGATAMAARGSVNSRLLSLLCLDEVRKEIVFFIDETTRATTVMREMVERFKLAKKHRGIAFSVPLAGIYGARKMKDVSNEEEVNAVMWQVIYTVVNKGDAKSVIDAANAAGARGGTILHGRGSSVHNETTIFDFPIEPEKEMVFVLAPKEKTDDIVASIHEALRIDEPGRGIIFVMNVAEAHGLAEQNA